MTKSKKDNEVAKQLLNLGDASGLTAELFDWLYSKAKESISEQMPDTVPALPQKIQPTPDTPNPLLSAAATERKAERKEEKTLQQEQKKDSQGPSLD